MKINTKYLLLSVVTAVAVVGLSVSALSMAQSVTPVACSSNVSSVLVNQSEVLSATGGNGTYVWSSPDLSIANPNGSGFSASYGSIGVKTLTVTSGGLVTTCSVNVLSDPVITVTPGLPNTGGGYGK